MSIDVALDRFIHTKCKGYSPTYSRLATEFRDFEPARRILSAAQSSPIRPSSTSLASLSTSRIDLFFACLQRRVLVSGRDDILPVFTHGLHSLNDPESAVRSILDFVADEEEALLAEVGVARLQTNDPGRCVALLMGLAEVAAIVESRPLHLLEIGTSAGLQLAFDRYAYKLTADDDTVDICPSDDLGILRPTISARTHGYSAADLPTGFPYVRERVGIDLSPIRVELTEDRLWLESFIWPEEVDRRSLLRNAISIVAADPPRIEEGDVGNCFEDTLSSIGDGTVCVYKSHATAQFPTDVRNRLDHMLYSHIDSGRCVELSLEGKLGGQVPAPKFGKTDGSYSALWMRDRSGQRPILVAGSHGGWVERL